MTIYVDDLVDYGLPGWRSGRWCHMATDGDIEALHAFARRIGLKLSWFQDDPRHPHYDLRPNKRELAIKCGAVAVSTQEMIARCWSPAVREKAGTTRFEKEQEQSYENN